MIQAMASGIGTYFLDRYNVMMSFLRVGFLVATLGLSALQMSCESAPMRTLRGARHYSAGSDALARSDGDRAVLELEQAAALVPHASEIQNHLGLAYWSEGRLDAARNSFERALELDCENQAAEVNLENLMTSVRVVEGGSFGRATQAEGSADGG